MWVRLRGEITFTLEFSCGVTHQSGGVCRTLLVQDLTFVLLQMKPEFWRLKVGWFPMTLGCLPKFLGFFTWILPLGGFLAAVSSCSSWSAHLRLCVERRQLQRVVCARLECSQEHHCHPKTCRGSREWWALWFRQVRKMLKAGGSASRLKLFLEFSALITFVRTIQKKCLISSLWLMFFSDERCLPQPSTV